MKNVILAITLSGIAFSSLAARDANANSNKDYYIQFNAGYAHGMKPKEDFQTGNMGNTSLFGAEVGYKFNKNFRIGASFDYLPSFANKGSSSRIRNGVPVTGESEIKVKSYIGMFNFYYDIFKAKGFMPYLTAGAGMAS